VTHRFEAFQKALPCLSPLQSTAVAQPITRWQVTALNGFGRLATCSVQARPDVASAWTRGRHRLDVWLVMVGHDLVGRHTVALDSLSKEGLGTRCVAVLAQEHVHDHAVLVDRPIQVPLVSLAEQEHLVYEPPFADGIADGAAPRRLVAARTPGPNPG
jgi:hypothetical protein